VAFILSRKRPLRLLVAYFVGGFGVSLIAGAVVLFVLKDVGVGKKSSVPPEIEVAVGALALVFAALVASGLAARLRDWAQGRRGQTDSVASSATDPAATTAPGAAPAAVATTELPGKDKLAEIEKLPGLRKLAPVVQRALASESPWLAWIAGVAIGMPSAYYLAAIAVILKAGVAAGTQVAALFVFNLVAFAVVAIPIVGYLVAPEATRARVEESYAWIGANQRVVITVLAGESALTC
jgi:hypothetical protein